MFLIIFLIVTQKIFTNSEEDFKLHSQKITHGEFKKIKIKGNSKAPNLEIEFNIPESWSAHEGDRPHVF